MMMMRMIVFSIFHFDFVSLFSLTCQNIPDLSVVETGHIYPETIKVKGRATKPHNHVTLITPKSFKGFHSNDYSNCLFVLDDAVYNGQEKMVRDI